MVREDRKSISEERSGEWRRISQVFKIMMTNTVRDGGREENDRSH